MQQGFLNPDMIMSVASRLISNNYTPSKLFKRLNEVEDFRIFGLENVVAFTLALLKIGYVDDLTLYQKLMSNIQEKFMNADSKVLADILTI